MNGKLFALYTTTLVLTEGAVVWTLLVLVVERHVRSFLQFILVVVVFVVVVLFLAAHYSSTQFRAA